MGTAALRAALVIAAVVLGVFVLSKAFPDNGEPPPVGGQQRQATEASPSPEEQQGGQQQQEKKEPEPHKPSTVTLQVLNGTDVDGLANETAGTLEQQGYNIMTITNAERPYNTTTLSFVPGFKPDAQALQRRYFRGAVLEAAAPNVGVDVTVILGEDYASRQA